MKTNTLSQTFCSDICSDVFFSKDFSLHKIFIDDQPADRLQPTKSTNRHTDLFESEHKKESLVGSHSDWIEGALSASD